MCSNFFANIYIFPLNCTLGTTRNSGRNFKLKKLNNIKACFLVILYVVMHLKLFYKQKFSLALVRQFAKANYSTIKTIFL